MNVYNKISSFASDVASDFSSVISKITSGFSDTISNISTGFSNTVEELTSGFKDVVDGIVALPKTIADLFESLFKKLFVPKDGYFDSKLEKVQKKFGFVDDIKDTITVFQNFFKETKFDEPPKITVDLSLYKKHDIGNSAVVLDMSWYKPYKSTVDTVLSSILWVTFIWRLLHSLPSIISGSGSMVSDTAEISGRSDDR